MFTNVFIVKARDSYAEYVLVKEGSLRTQDSFD